MARPDRHRVLVVEDQVAVASSCTMPSPSLATPLRWPLPRPRPWLDWSRRSRSCALAISTFLICQGSSCSTAFAPSGRRFPW